MQKELFNVKPPDEVIKYQQEVVTSEKNLTKFFSETKNHDRLLRFKRNSNDKSV